MCFHQYKIPRMGKFLEAENRMVISRSSGEGVKGSFCSVGTVSVWDENALEMVLLVAPQNPCT